VTDNNNPRLGRLETLVREIFPLAERELEALKDVYADGDTGEITDERAKLDVEKLERFTREALTLIPELEALREAIA
jgi:hypothetical protein